MAAGIIEKLADSSAAPADLSVSNEGTAGATFGSDQGAFLVNWTYIWTNYDETQPEVKEDLGFTRYPQSVEGEESRPPYGGIGIGVSAYSTHIDEAMQAVECITIAENQGVNAELTGNMPASAAGYDYPALKEIYPQDLLDLFQESLDAAAPAHGDAVLERHLQGLQSTWHPPDGVTEHARGFPDLHRGRAARKGPAVSTQVATPGAEPIPEKPAKPADRDRSRRRTGSGSSWSPPP